MDNNEPLVSDLSAIWELSEARVLKMIMSKKLTTDAAAKMIGVERSEIYDMISRGEIMAFKLRTRYRIPERSVIDYISRKLVATALE